MKNGTQGFTLIGLITLIIVSAIAVPPLLLGVTQWLEKGYEATQMEKAVQLGSDLMDEILSKSFADPDGTEESARQSFDDVDDYDGWTSSPPRDCTGSTLTVYGPFTRSATVVNVQGTALGAELASQAGSTDYKRITVRIDWEGEYITLQGLKVRFDQVIDDSDSDGTIVKEGN
jgi:MSHA pilin protein MshD